MITLAKTKTMRLLITILLAALTSALSAQGWEETPLVDEFGDPTGTVARVQFCEGTFSNSATSNTEMTARIQHQNEIIVIDLFEYNQAPGATLGLSDAVGKIKVKRADGTVEEYEAYSPENAGLYFLEGSVGDEFYNLVMSGNGEQITVLVKESSFTEYGNATYRFKMLTLGGEE